MSYHDAPNVGANNAFNRYSSAQTPTKPASASHTIQGIAVAVLPVALRVVRDRRVTLTDAVALGGAALAVWGRFRASPLRVG